MVNKAKPGQKRNKASGSSSKNGRPTKKRHVEEAAPVKRAKPQKIRNKGSTRSAVELVEARERELSDEDFENFEDYQDFHGFLQNLDPQALANKVKKEDKTKLPVQKRKAAPAAAVESSDEDNLEDSDIDSDDEGSVETVSDASYDDEMDDIVSEDDDEDDVAGPGRKESATKVDYEDQVRSFGKSQDEEESNRLPIKLKDGRVTRNPNRVQKNEPVVAPAPNITPNVAAQTFEPVIQSMKDEPILTPAQRLVQTQEKLAQLALEIIEDPEEKFTKLGRIKDIQNEGNLQEKRLAILTLSAVFKDIIPGYRIRPLTELEKAEKVTKDVRRLRDFEQTLVGQYKDFVNTLVTLTRTSRKSVVLSAEETILKKTAVAAACSLLKAVPHFNFRIELFNILVGQVCRKKVDDLFLMSRETIEELFREDQEGEASCEGMRLLCKKLKDRDYQVDESTIGTFLHLRLLTDMEARGSTERVDREKVKKKDRQFRTKKLKKLIKDQKEVERDMREAEATVDTETRERLQGETLKLTFTTYLRILKEGNRQIIGAALEGLTKFATLINVDFFGDLLEVLKELMSNEVESAQLSTRETLLCIITAFTLLSGQAATKETIGLDLSKFMSRLYACMLPLALDADVELSTKSQRDNSEASTTIKQKINVATEMEMLLRALDAMFFKQRVHGSARMTAFVKRLTLVTLHFPEKSAAAALELVKRLAARYDKIYTLFATEETARDGTYDACTDSVDLCNPAATSVWEMALMKRHYSPKVQQAGAALMTTLQEGMTNRR